MCLWVARGWKVGEIEVQDRRSRQPERRQETVLADEKTTISDGRRIAAANEAGVGTGEYRIWSPRTLVRNMFAWKVV